MAEKKKTNAPLNYVKPFGSIKDMLAQQVIENGEKIAYMYRGGEGIVNVTYREFYDDVRALGTAIHTLVQGDAHVGCSGENSYNWIVVYLAALTGSTVFCPIDKDLPENDMVNIIVGGEQSIVFCDAKREKLLASIRDRLPDVKYFVCFDREEDDGEFLSYKKLLQKGRELYAAGERAYERSQTASDELKMLIYTSGTTGLAKGVMLSEHNLCSAVYYGLQRSTIRDIGLSVLPYHHSYESVAGLLVAIRCGATLFINDSIKRVLKNMQVCRPQYIYLVPAFVEVFYRRIMSVIEEKGKTKTIEKARKMSNMLLKSGIDIRKKLFREIHENFGGRLEKIVCGGAPIRAEVGKFFEDIGIILCNGYGITECSPLVSANPDVGSDCTTVGYPLACLEVKIDEPNADGEGEILVKGDVVMMGYYHQPEATAAVIRDGWFYTGDYGRIDEKGRLVITGRKKNIIILGNGKNIYPEELEGYIAGISYITDCIVYADRDADGVESALCAECAIDPEVLAGTDREELRARVKSDIFKTLADLPAYKQVARVVVRDKPFVKTASAKIRRAADGKPLE